MLVHRCEASLSDDFLVLYPPLPSSSSVKQGGVVWRSWHMSYKSNVDEYYAKYEAAQRAKNAQQQQQ